MTEPLAGGVVGAPLSMRATASLSYAAVRFARKLLADLECGRRIDAAVLCGAMETAFGRSDAAGACNWKIAYDACEVATIVLLRKFGSGIRAKMDRKRFTAVWRVELAEESEAAESTIHVWASLLLPIWKRSSNESTRAHRLQIDVDQCIVGRDVSVALIANVLAADVPVPTPDAASVALMEGVLDFAEELQLRSTRAIDANRIKLPGSCDTMRDRHRANRLIRKIISWKFRIYVLMHADGAKVILKMPDGYPIASAGGREAV